MSKGDNTKEKKTSTNTSENVSANNNKDIKENTNGEEQKKVVVKTLDDIDDNVEEEKISEQERIKQILEKNTPNVECTLDKKKDEKLKNIMTYSCIPFVLIAIAFSLFNIGRVRHPLSFLFLSIGLGILSVFYYLRRQNLLKCKCPVCETQAKTTLQFCILWGVIALGLLGAFIYFMIVPQTA